MTTDNYATSAQPPIDHAVLTRMVGDNSDIHRHLLAKFISLTPATIQQIHQACSQQQAEAVTQYGHTLKSSARAMGANELAEVCQQLEIMGGSQNWPQIAQLELRLDPLMAAIMDYVNSLPEK
ncbi:MAG: Hpt domain-containing protein [Gammaproteobacteria bacterium]|nr:Hpt domain-containing protein [Gammaproteobacteria bacterium]